MLTCWWFETGVMMRTMLAVVLMCFVVVGCGDDSEESSSEASVVGGAGETSDDDVGGAAVDAAPPGQATAVVDGLDLDFDLPGALECSISEDSITFSHRIGDNEITLGGGLNRVDGGWMGSIALTVADPTDEPGPIAYYPAPEDVGVLDESLFAVDGQSMSYVGPMLKQPANDGSLPPPVEVGDGVITASCE